MKLQLYQVDAFTADVFKGNFAGVCPLEKKLPAEMMQSIAMENNLPETAFFVKDETGYAIRWFTPDSEIDLCGHATLASAYIIFTYLEPSLDTVSFSSKSGVLTVTKEDNLLAMLFPSRAPSPFKPPDALLRGLKIPPVSVLRSERDIMAVYSSPEEVEALSPSFSDLAQCDALGIIATTRGRSTDFVSRFFAPSVGIPEDPATGSSHCTLIPYWAKELNKKKLTARQLSKRGEIFYCEDMGDKVKIAGQVALYMEGTIHVPGTG